MSAAGGLFSGFSGGGSGAGGLCFSVCVLLGCAASWAAGTPDEGIEWIPFAAPQLRVQEAEIEADPAAGSIRVRTSIPGLLLRRRETAVAADASVGAAKGGGVDAAGFDSVDVPDYSYLPGVGKPRLPAKSYWLEIPAGVRPEVRFVTHQAERIEDVRIVPVQPLPPDVLPAPPPEPFALDAAVYEGDEVYPAESVFTTKVAGLRDRNLLQVVVAPAQFDPAGSSLEVASDYELEITWDPETAEPPAVSDSPALPVYMILVPDLYATNAALQALADWKRRKGLDVRVVKTSQIHPGGAPDHAQITAYLRGLSEGDYPLYLLVVGPHTPTNGVAGAYFNTSSTDYYGYTDLDLACRTSDDFLPDLFHGRLPTQSQAELTAMATKALAMDRTPPASGMYRRVVVAGQIQDSDNGGDGVADRLFCETADCIARHFEANTGGISYSSVRAIVNPNAMTATGRWNSSSLLWNPTNEIGSRVATQFVSVATAQSRISSWANAGAALVQHRDHGYVNGVGWGDPHYLYTHVNALTNGANVPAVFSINCNSGMYNFPNNFVRAWLAKSNGGAYAVFAPVDTSYSWLNDWLTHGFYTAFLSDYVSGQNASTAPAWPKKLPAPGGMYGAAGSARKLGEILNFGKFYMAEKFWLDEDTFRLFHLFGDPESPLRLVEPKANTVTHPAMLHMEVTAVTVEVSQAASTVCLYGPSVGIHAAASPEGGRAVFSLALTNSGTLHVTVTGDDLRPYEGQIAVFRGGQPFTFQALPLAGSVMLRWSDPRESGWLSPQVRIRASTNGYPENAGSGRAVYAGEALQHLDDEVSNGVTYYYSIWATDDGVTFVEP